MIDDDDTFADILDISEIVRGEEDGRLLGPVDFIDDLPKLLLRNDIKADGRLIEENDPRGVDEAGNKLASHPLSERELPDRDIHQILHLESLDQEFDPRFQFLSGDLEDSPEELEAVGRGEMVPESRGLSED